VTTWGDVLANQQGIRRVRHAVLTYNGTWGAGIVQYPGNVVDGLAEFVDPDLCYEVPCPYPATFGPIGGAVDADSYEQSIDFAVQWTGNWYADNPFQTNGLIGYSQGAEAASRVLMELQDGSLTDYMPNFIGGITFGNPCRKAGTAAPGIANPPGWRGISTTQITKLPKIKGLTVWADYFHSTANGDAGNDMYAMVPTGQVGTIMSDVYTTATQAQLNNAGVFLQDMVNDMLQIVKDSGVLNSLKGGLPGLLALGGAAMLTFLTDLIGVGNVATATGTDADVAAAVLGLKFLTGPGGPTGPHISYGGEIPGYSNLLGPAVGFLADIARLTRPRAAA
jgi:hypothetical protein